MRSAPRVDRRGAGPLKDWSRLLIVPGCVVKTLGEEGGGFRSAVVVDWEVGPLRVAGGGGEQPAAVSPCACPLTQQKDTLVLMQ